MKTSKITLLTFKNEWNTPQGAILKVYDIKLESGESGTTYLKQNESYNIGDDVNYTINGDKIKIMGSASQSSQNNGKTAYDNPKIKSKGNYNNSDAHKITYYLGYAYGYAKDIAIEEAKLSKSKEINLDRLEEVSERIYNHMEQLFNKDKQ